MSSCLNSLTNILPRCEIWSPSGCSVSESRVLSGCLYECEKEPPPPVLRVFVLCFGTSCRRMNSWATPPHAPRLPASSSVASSPQLSMFSSSAPGPQPATPPTAPSSSTKQERTVSPPPTVIWTPQLKLPALQPADRLRVSELNCSLPSSELYPTAVLPFQSIAKISLPLNNTS